MQLQLKYLLVMPRLVRNVGDSYGFPLGIAYVSSSMRKAGFRVATLNLNHCDGKVVDIIQRQVIDGDIDVIMTGGLSAQYSMVRSIIEAAKIIKPDIVSVVGGGIITSDPAVAMTALDYVDIGVIGEGELTSVELGYALETGADLAQVDGLIFRSPNCGQSGLAERIEDNFIQTRKRKEIADVDTIPWPDYEGFDLEKNLSATLGVFGFNESNALPMISSRSCPYGCTFCFHTVGRKYRQRSMDGIFAELDYLISKYKIDSLALSDELFGLKFSRLEEFCKRIKKYNLKWLAGFRVDQITQEMMPLLKESNCMTIGFGLESADDRILKSMRKKITLEQTERALKLVHEAGINISAGFIFGDKEETLETATNTLNWWKQHPEYGATLRLITPYPGTPLYHYACEQGIIKDRVDYLRQGCPQVNVSRMSDDELKAFTKTMMDAVLSNTMTLVAYKLGNINQDSGCVDIKGRCRECEEVNEWNQVRLFKSTFVACRACGQQYHAPLDETIRGNIETNLTRLLAEHGKLAVWGMTNHAVEMFSQSEVLRNPYIYPVDICDSKQTKDFFGKEVYPPEIIEKEQIELVVVTAPYHIGYIESQIDTHYKSVVRVVDISNLIGPSQTCVDMTCYVGGDRHPDDVKKTRKMTHGFI